MIDDHDGCEWVNVSSGTGSPRLSWPKSIEPKMVVCVCVGEKWEVSDNILLVLEEFTCQMYKKAVGVREVDELVVMLSCDAGF